jgi:hypothetical protein
MKKKGIMDRSDPVVDKGLVAMFLKMTPEQRLKANDNAVRTILELRYAREQKKDVRTGSECNN